MDNEMLPHDVIELKISAPSVKTQAQALASAIKTRKDIDDAFAWCSARQAEVTAVENRLAGGIKKMREALQEWLDLRTDATQSRKDSIKLVKERIGYVDLELKRKEREEEDRRLRAAAKRDEEERLKRAERLEKQGDPIAADAVISGAGNFVAPLPAPDKPKNGYVSTVWCAEVTNLREFIAWVNAKGNLEGEDNALLPNEDWLCMRAKQSNGIAKIPGVRFYEKPRVALAPRRIA